MVHQPPTRQQNSNIYSPSAVKKINSFSGVKLLTGMISVLPDEESAWIIRILSHSLDATPINWMMYKHELTPRTHTWANSTFPTGLLAHKTGSRRVNVPTISQKINFPVHIWQNLFSLPSKFSLSYHVSASKLSAMCDEIVFRFSRTDGRIVLSECCESAIAIDLMHVPFCHGHVNSNYLRERVCWGSKSAGAFQRLLGCTDYELSPTVAHPSVLIFTFYLFETHQRLTFGGFSFVKFTYISKKQN